jgi:hypothetical protein
MKHIYFVIVLTFCISACATSGTATRADEMFMKGDPLKIAKADTIRISAVKAFKEGNFEWAGQYFKEAAQIYLGEGMKENAKKCYLNSGISYLRISDFLLFQDQIEQYLTLVDKYQIPTLKERRIVVIYDLYSGRKPRYPLPPAEAGILPVK